MNEFLFYVLGSAGAGFAIGLTGVGGGSLTTPLPHLFNYLPPAAIGSTRR
ncbi:MAG: hypothetical protein R3F50_16800 [Gammaproteobacteria bacterium]